MLRDERKVGGHTIAMTHGMDQAFADHWREMAHMPTVKVNVVLAHGYPVGDRGFGRRRRYGRVRRPWLRRAITRTLLKSAAWDAILHGVERAR